MGIAKTGANNDLMESLQCEGQIIYDTSSSTSNFIEPEINILVLYILYCC